MGRTGDLPHAAAHVSEKTRSPWVAIVIVGVLIAGLVGIGSISIAWTFSATTVLAYYALTNLCALRLPKPSSSIGAFALPALAMTGLIGCVVLAFAVPIPMWLAAIGVLVFGIGLRFFFHGMRPMTDADQTDGAE